MKLFEVVCQNTIVKLQHFIFAVVFIFFIKLCVCRYGIKQMLSLSFLTNFVKQQFQALKYFLEIVHVARLLSYSFFTK